MNTKAIAAVVWTLLTANAHAADTLRIERVRMAGPIAVRQPVVLDSMSADRKTYSKDNIIDTHVSLATATAAADCTLGTQTCEPGALYLASFRIDVRAYGKVSAVVEGVKAHKAYLDGEEWNGSVAVRQGLHDVAVKFVGGDRQPAVAVAADRDGMLAQDDQNQKRLFTIDDIFSVRRYGGVSISPSGKYLTTTLSHTNSNGHAERQTAIKELATGRTVSTNASIGQWMAHEDRCYRFVNRNSQTDIVATDIATGREETLARDVPCESGVLSPNARYLIYNIESEAPAKGEGGVYEVANPEDRQPGYRTRQNLAVYDMASGVGGPLTYGKNSAYLHDISHDSRYIVFSESFDSLTIRPSSLANLYRLDMTTMKVDTLARNEGFFRGARFVPGSTDRILVTATPEAFGGLGRNLPEGMTPSMYQYELYEVNAANGDVKPLTRDFDPSISEVHTSSADGMVYFTADNRDRVSLYRLDPLTAAIAPIDTPVDVVSGVAVAKDAPVMAFYGSSPCMPQRLYQLPLKGKKAAAVLLDDPNSEWTESVTLGTCEDFSFRSKRGYDLTGFCFLPAGMDPEKKYPVMVYYYGGCSPEQRSFRLGSFVPHYWNAQGYIAVIINPSGAAGFGQEWSARHVNTAGEGVTDDIIEATLWFADNHPYADREHIGCMGASYGGFITQSLLSKTDIFAFGISHAGISSHTSYWGEGYWGYTYSQVSMANSLPWTRKDLFVDRSPLYNADKIHTPLLFTHGTADTNVPVGESIQMFTALKVLGVPTAFVMFEGENHGITDYAKRRKWYDTQMAWANRWAKGDSTWWNDLYPAVE